jgi:tetratricopeptide (TPR) repeat protein
MPSVARVTGCLLLLLATSCHSAAFDPVAELDALDRAQAALDQGELALALCAFDEVEVVDPRYATARLNAAAVEQRLFRQQELVLLGLHLRSEWRDDEAIAVFTEALVSWPEDLHTQQLLRGTVERRRLLARSRAIDLAPAEVPAIGAPFEAAVEPGAPPAPAAETAAALHLEVESPMSVEATRVGPDDLIGGKLVRLEERLQRGELDSVLAEFAAMQQKWPGDPRVCGRLARLLLQRGLLHYGRGQLDAAIADWRRAQALDPQLAGLPMLIELATRELALPPR